MSDQDFLEEDTDPDHILGELDSLKDLLGSEEEPDPAEAEPAAARDSGDAEGGPQAPAAAEPDETDLDAFLDDDQGGSSAAGAGSAGAADDQGGSSVTDMDVQMPRGQDAQERPAGAGSAGAADDPALPADADAPTTAAETDPASGPEDEVPLLDEVVFRGDDVPGEAIELMSAMRTAPDADAGPAPAEETAPQAEAAADTVTPPADPAELEALVEAAVDRRLQGLREELKAELLAALREPSGRD